MKIKRKSWHYRIANLGRDWERNSDSLCGYFWRLIGKSAVIIGLIGVLYIIGVLWFTNPLWISNTIMFVFIMLTIFLPPLLICYLREKFKGSFDDPIGALKPTKCENILIAYLKAKKEKICPLIKYVD